MKTDKTNAEFLPFNRNILPERIALQLLEMIKERKLRPGDRLPPERELAVMMQVSRPSLREALRALSLMNVIENRQGSGTYVTALEPDRLVENFSFILSLDVQTFIQVLEARKVIEVGLASMAAQKITPQQTAELEELLAESALHLDEPETFMQSDIEIHRKIADIAQNQILTIFMSSINNINLASRRRTVEMRDVRQSTLEDHRRLVEALKRRDPQAAADAMRHHLNSVEQHLQDAAQNPARS